MKTKQLILYFSILVINILLFSCIQKEKKNKLDGVWFTDAEWIYSSQSDLGLYFDKDTIYSIYNEAHILDGDGIFQIINDTILFKNHKEQTQKYIIKKHTNDSLILLINGEEKRLHNERLEFNDNLKFSKISIIVGEDIDPYYFITLDSLGNIFAEERIDKEKMIKKQFKLNSSELNRIDSLFKFSCIDKTDTVGWDSGYDGWPKSMKFEYNNKSTVIRTIHFSMPYRIQPIFYRIMLIVMNKNTIDEK